MDRGAPVEADRRAGAGVPQVRVGGVVAGVVVLDPHRLEHPGVADQLRQLVREPDGERAAAVEEVDLHARG